MSAMECVENNTGNQAWFPDDYSMLNNWIVQWHPMLSTTVQGKAVLSVLQENANFLTGACDFVKEQFLKNFGCTWGLFVSLAETNCNDENVLNNIRIAVNSLLSNMRNLDNEFPKVVKSISTGSKRANVNDEEFKVPFKTAKVAKLNQPKPIDVNISFDSLANTSDAVAIDRTTGEGDIVDPDSAAAQPTTKEPMPEPFFVKVSGD